MCCAMCCAVLYCRCAGACIFMTSRCYFTIMKLDLLQYVPQRFSLIAHFNDIATPDMDVKKKGTSFLDFLFFLSA